jgi:hypothetical protein
MKLPEMDKAMAMLLQDLADRDLLDSTIVWWSGEFGRTAKIQWEPPYNGGRGHWGSVFSALLAGGISCPQKTFTSRWSELPGARQWASGARSRSRSSQVERHKCR